MWSRIQTTDNMGDMGVGKIFCRGGALGDFYKIFPRGAESGEICCFPLETKKTTFFC